MQKVKKSEITIRFGQALRRRRTVLGFTQELLAEKADLHRTYVADIERGKRNVSLKNVEKLAKALGLSMAELMASVGCKS